MSFFYKAAALPLSLSRLLGKREPFNGRNIVLGSHLGPGTQGWQVMLKSIGLAISIKF
jgi:hypothetical protein